LNVIIGLEFDGFLAERGKRFQEVQVLVVLGNIVQNKVFGVKEGLGLVLHKGEYEAVFVVSSNLEGSGDVVEEEILFRDDSGQEKVRHPSESHVGV